MPLLELRRFSGNPVQRPEFIEIFRNNIHSKVTFSGDICMARLLSVLKGDAKISVQSIGTNGIFCATALKTLKRNFRDKILISDLKSKNLFDQPQIKGSDRITLRQYHHQLKTFNAWLISIRYEHLFFPM